jgi:3-deoxy-D-manno-octulosonic-acid transferase
MLQGLFKSKAFAKTVGTVLGLYVQFVRRTSSMTDDPPGFVQKNLPDHPLIIAMWHGQGLLLPYVRPSEDIKVAIMVAKHIDGDIVHAAVSRFGMTTIRGAGAGRKGKDKGGFDALRACMQALRSDTTIAVTADIPPGPARKAGLGLVTLSKISGRGILPCAVVTKNYLKLNTWSGFTLNLPFSKIIMTGGEQIQVPRHASAEDLETARQLLEDSMNEITARAYRIAGTSERGIANDTDPVAFGPMLRAYVRVTRWLQPTAKYLLKYRERQGKEEAGRTNERLGLASSTRKAGTLVWLHAASVGESNAVLHLIEKLMSQRPDLQILLTTGTVTSAKLARARLPEGAIHQYIPLDTPDFMKRFFDHWQPSLATLTESEIWPNLIREARTRDIPLLLINGRISPRSFRRWRKRFKIARPLFSSLDLVLAQSDRYAGYFERLGSRNVLDAGNLKMDAPPPPVDQASLQRLKQAIVSRPVFLAASTHPGEEDIIASAHNSLKTDLPDLLTIIVPRHPNRGSEICEMLKSKGLKCIQRTQVDTPSNGEDIYLADTIGELGMFYDLALVAFIGGSLVKHGGQNPIEAIMHNTAVLTGPNVHNFEETYSTLLNGEACIEVSNKEEITSHVLRLFQDETARKLLIERAQSEIDEMRGALDITLEALEAFLPPAKEKRRAS